MSIVQLPLWRVRGRTDRIAASRPNLQLVRPEAVSVRDFCDRCAAPIGFGAVMHGRGVFCSVECSLEGPISPA
ncbi:MAG TPA: hypothetical protein VI384_01065 [Candidatus Dormibacteraeota bacterium]